MAAGACSAMNRRWARGTAAISVGAVVAILIVIATCDGSSAAAP